MAGKVRQSILSFEPGNARICKMRLRERFRNVNFISMDGPTEDSEDKVKLDFYQDLEITFFATPCYNVTIVLGDLNAQCKTGKKSFFSAISGQFTLHSETNDNESFFVSLWKPIICS